MSSVVSNNYTFTENDKIFIDTNIWVFLFSPSFIDSAEWQIEKYSTIFSNLIESNAKIFISGTVISEFINLCLKTDFNKSFNRDGTKNYKRDYRGSSNYNETYSIIINEVKRIFAIPNITLVNDEFSSMYVEELLSQYRQSDFNDLIIYHISQEYNLKVLTNDGDFSDFENIQLIS